jgi:type I restriction enzyme S subunit
MPYIGLEHIEEGTLRLLKLGTTTDVISAKSRFESGDILFGKLRPYFRKVVRPRFSGICSTDIWVVRTKQDIDQGYLFYWMASQEFVDAATQASEGTKMPRAKWDFLERIEKPVPPLPEQRAIAHILGTLDDKIELNRRMNQTLEAMAQALFKSWFVDFEPFRDQGMQDSPLGEIPAGWRVVSIKDIAERVGMGPFGSSIKVSTFVPDGIPIISGQHLNQTLLEDNHYNFITPSHAEKLKNSNVFRGDIIFTHAGNIGQVAYIPETSQYERYVISQRQFYMRCDLSKISPLFVIYFSKTPQGQHSLLANTSSTGVPSISQPVSYLKTIKLPVPTKTLIDAFDKIVRKLHLQIANNISQAKTLSAIRDALLPRLLSGEVRVKDAERFVQVKI